VYRAMLAHFQALRIISRPVRVLTPCAGRGERGDLSRAVYRERLLSLVRRGLVTPLRTRSGSAHACSPSGFVLFFFFYVVVLSFFLCPILFVCVVLCF